MDNQNILIREATNQDFDAIWEIFHKVVQAGDTYSYAPDTTREEAYLYWMPPHKKTYVAMKDDKIVGTYVLKPNQPKLGAHVANAGYMVHPDAQGLGVGREMALHSIEEAKKQGYLSMQFNLVVSTNKPAVHLWEKLGFQIIGTTPQGFQHPTLGLVDTYIMYQAF